MTNLVASLHPRPLSIVTPRAPVLVILSLLALPAVAQSPQEVGLPFAGCTSATETGGANQIWSMIQDDRGIIYVSSDGAIEFDGSSWRLAPNEGQTVVRSLAHDSKGRIFLGGTSEIGYLEADSIGHRRYHSLTALIPEHDRDFLDVWTTHATREGVYFLAREKLFLASESEGTWKVRVWSPAERFLFGFLHGDTYYVQQQGIGFSRMDGDRLVPVPGGSQFGGERLQVMLPDAANPAGFLLGTFNRGLFRFDGSGFTPWKTELDEYLRSTTLYKGTVLRDGNFALATLSGGVVLLSPDGKRRGILKNGSGLPSNSALSLLVDRSGLLWAGLSGWICQIDVSSPLSRFDASLGLEGELTSILRHEGVLYITTQDAVQYLDAASGTLKHVRGFAKGVAQSWQLLSFQGDLLVSSGTGLYLIQGDRAVPIIRNEGGVAYSPIALLPSAQDSNRVFVGLLDGVASIYREGPGRYRDEGPLGFPIDARQLSEPSPGILWIGSLAAGAARIHLRPDRTIEGDVERFGRESGFQSTSGLVVALGKEIVGLDVDRIVRFDEPTHRFVVDSLLSTLVHGRIRGGYLSQAVDGVAYMNAGSESAALYPDSTSRYRIERTPFLRFADTPARAIYAEADGVVWFGTDRALIRYDPRVPKAYDVDFPVLVRRVSATHGREVFAGGAPTEAIHLPFSENNLQFDYAAAVFDKPSASTYRTLLEGFDEDWSEWKTEARREYTNIPPGRYTFRVRARDVYEHEGTAASFAFTILPPWYRSIWAYLFYGLVLAGAVFATDRVQRRRLVRKERARSAIEQAELRAAAAEAQSKAFEADNERKRNNELLSRIGRDITSTLSIEQIIDTVYEHVNAMMDASVFGIGIYSAAENRLEFPATKERGETLPFFVNHLDDRNRIAVWCFTRRVEVVINDLQEEWSRYLDEFVPAVAGADAASILYLPLVHNEKAIGVITAQSFEKNAYTEDHLNILRNLAVYAAIALDNADAYRQLNATVQELNQTLDNLKTTQEQLVTQEKMASLGALTAGIAHEVKNPLNFVNNFAGLIVELADELKEELTSHRDRRVADVLEQLDEIVSSLKTNARHIAKHGKRADDIVRGMMQHASGGSGERFEVAVNGFVDEYIQLAYHGMRARPDAIDVDTRKELAPDAGMVTMVPQEIGRVLVNLLNNAFDAVREHGSTSNGAHEPRVTVRTRRIHKRVEIEVEDNGSGVPPHVQEKIFEPFFTTKPAGSGTGLGLSLSYDVVVHGHGGTLSVENVPGGGARFMLSLPLSS